MMYHICIFKGGCQRKNDIKLRFMKTKNVVQGTQDP